MEALRKVFQIDWRIFMEGTQVWLAGGNPYGPLSAEFGAGAFAYPPTALPWLAVWTLLGPLGYYVWTALQLGGWWMLVKDERPAQIMLLCWPPMILHLVEGQSTLPVVLVLWAALRAPKRGMLWGLAIAWALTKPQAALLPVLWLLWLDRASPTRLRLIAGIALGTLALALPPTLANPQIWVEWLVGLQDYRLRLTQMAAWEGLSALLLLLAAYLWYRSGYGEWHWWGTAALFPQTSYYGIVALIPAMRPQVGLWFYSGLLCAVLLMLPLPYVGLPWYLAVHTLLGWMVGGGPQRLRAGGAAAPPAVSANVTADVYNRGRAPAIGSASDAERTER